MFTCAKGNLHNFRQTTVVYATLSFFRYNRYLFCNLWQADDRLIPRHSNLIWWLTYTDLIVPEVAEGVALTSAAIGQAYQQTRAMDETAGFMVVIIPFREQVYTDPMLQLKLDRPNNALIEYGRQHDILVLDLAPAVRHAAEAEPVPLYFRRDIHFNHRGNELVAELLREKLAINPDE